MLKVHEKLKKKILKWKFSRIQVTKMKPIKFNNQNKV